MYFINEYRVGDKSVSAIAANPLDPEIAAELGWWCRITGPFETPEAALEQAKQWGGPNIEELTEQIQAYDITFGSA